MQCTDSAQAVYRQCTGSVMVAASSVPPLLWVRLGDAAAHGGHAGHLPINVHACVRGCDRSVAYSMVFNNRRRT